MLVHYCPTCQHHYTCDKDTCSWTSTPQHLFCPAHDLNDDSAHAHLCTGCYHNSKCEDDECDDKDARYKLCVSCQALEDEEDRLWY